MFQLLQKPVQQEVNPLKSLLKTSQLCPCSIRVDDQIYFLIINCVLLIQKIKDSEKQISQIKLTRDESNSMAKDSRTYDKTSTKSCLLTPKCLSQKLLGIKLENVGTASSNKCGPSQVPSRQQFLSLYLVVTAIFHGIMDGTTLDLES